MIVATQKNPEDIIAVAAAAARRADRDLQALLETFSAPIYLTDAEGFVTYFNQACADFAGRMPIAGTDRWCVTWRLFSEAGERIPHEECPMAVSIREKRDVRGMTAVAERPDGSRVLFQPYPSPILDEGGGLIGAVNMLVDVTDARQAKSLLAQARRCRRLAHSVTDRQTIETLNAMAVEYEQKAQALAEARSEPQPINAIIA